MGNSERVVLSNGEGQIKKFWREPKLFRRHLVGTFGRNNHDWKCMGNENEELGVAGKLEYGKERVIRF